MLAALSVVLYIKIPFESQNKSHSAIAAHISNGETGLLPSTAPTTLAHSHVSNNKLHVKGFVFGCVDK